MPSEPKRHNKSKEEIVQEAFLVAEAKRKRARVKAEIYPLLKEKSKNIEHAKVICTAASLAVEHAFSNLQRDMKVKELKITQHINKDGDDSDTFRTLMDMIEDETIEGALSMIRDLPHAIDSFIREEMTKRPLSSLKEDLLD